MNDKPLFRLHLCLFKFDGSGLTCDTNADYVARDNRAKFGHVCERHYRMLPRVKQDHYARIQ